MLQERLALETSGALALENTMKPVCPHCRLFLVEREGLTCEPCRKRLGRRVNRKKVLASWARRKAERAKEATP